MEAVRELPWEPGEALRGGNLSQLGDVEIHDGPAALEVQAERVNGRAEALLPDKLFPLAL